MAVTDVPLTLGVAVTLALLVSGRIELAGVAAGVAMGFKYPGIFLLVPLVSRRLAAVAPPRGRAGRRGRGAFARTNPFFVVALSARP